MLPVGLGRQASAPLIEPWGLVVELRRPVAAPVLLSRAQAARLARALVEMLYPDKARRAALVRAGHVLALADGLMASDTFLTDVDVQRELEDIAAYLGRVLPAAPAQDEERSAWMTLTDCFHATEKSDDMAAFATGLYNEPESRSLCLPLFRAHFEHQGAQADTFGDVFANAAYEPRSRKLDEVLARALGVEVADILKLALVALPQTGVVGADEPLEEEASLAFGTPGYEGELFARAVRDRHELDACEPGEGLARALQAMRVQAVDEQAIQFGWRRGVPVAVKPGGDVMLGFATVDEMAAAVREAFAGRDISGEQLALRWQHWLMGHYIPLLWEISSTGCQAAAFSAPAAASPKEAGAGHSGTQRELPALEAVVVENSLQADGDVSTGVRAQAWRCLALSVDDQENKNARHGGHGSAFLLCAVLTVLDRDDHPVQQLNFFHTTPFAADTLKDSVEHCAERMKLPLEWRYTLLQVGDESQRLTVREAHELHVSAQDGARQTPPRRDH